ncbi:hypothetical protein PXW85_27155, partial [Klebsiella pneumoniae]|nr:hypothetical protein [Klebsiella pneumoniae]
RLCMSSAVTGYKRAFGADVVPCSYDDVENSDLVVLVGSNAAWDITRGWHGDGRLRMVPVTPQPTRATTDAFYPLILNSGRI